MEKKIQRFGYVYWILAALFYFYQYVLRVSTGVVADNLMVDFHVTASTIGTVMGVASFAYVFCQMPAGALTDFFGVRKLLPIAVGCAAFGAYLFSKSTSLEVLMASRIFLGAASAFAFIGCTKIISDYFPFNRMAFFVSFTMLIGSSGGVVGVGPLAYLVESFGWREAMGWVGVLGFIIAGLLFFMGRIQRYLPIKPQSLEAIERPPLSEGIKQALKTPAVLTVCLWGFCIYMPICVFADGWGVPYLMTALQMEKAIAAGHVSVIYVGILFGCVFYGWLGAKCPNFRWIFVISTASLLGLFTLLIWHLHWIHNQMNPIFFMIGFLISVQLLMFPAAVQHVPRAYTASVVGVVNTATMASGAIFQKLVGVGVDYLWDGQLFNGAPRYTMACYQMPLSIIIVMLSLGTVASFFVQKPARQAK